MGTTKFKKATKDTYTLAEIERALSHRGLMYLYAEQGDMDVMHLVIDAERVLALAEPTPLQIKTVDLVYRQGYSLTEAGRELGVTIQAVYFNLTLLKTKMKKILKRWEKESTG